MLEKHLKSIVFPKADSTIYPEVGYYRRIMYLKYFCTFSLFFLLFRGALRFTSEGFPQRTVLMSTKKERYARSINRLSYKELSQSLKVKYFIAFEENVARSCKLFPFFSRCFFGRVIVPP